MPFTTERSLQTVVLHPEHHRSPGCSSQSLYWQGRCAGFPPLCLPPRHCASVPKPCVPKALFTVAPAAPALEVNTKNPCAGCGTGRGGPPRLPPPWRLRCSLCRPKEPEAGGQGPCDRQAVSWSLIVSFYPVSDGTMAFLPSPYSVKFPFLRIQRP